MHLRQKTAVVIGTVAALAAPAGIAAAAPASSDAVRRMDPDTTFVITAHQSNLAQMALGKIAATRGTDRDVRALGAKFAADSAKLEAGLRPVAASIGVPLGTLPSATVTQLVTEYKSVPAAKFDALFISSQATLHEQAVKVVQTELKEGDAVQVKRAAQAALPVITAHRAALKSAQTRLGAIKRK
ncbi:DUF4142 domain-containing protein [Actinoplanes sp. NPDC051851]|uniref:DUF4142 domain-containing protein n=1 Tax=Actinoplanes sp. NPDC051851 TaxID=3154753 RepID=UPI0034468CA9